MKLVTFIDNRFQELRLAEQEGEKKREFSLLRESEQHALHAVRKAAGTLLKWLLIPVIFGRYVLVLLGFAKAPEPVLVRLLEKARAKEDAKKLAKIGMKDLGGKKEVGTAPEPA